MTMTSRTHVVRLSWPVAAESVHWDWPGSSHRPERQDLVAVVAVAGPVVADHQLQAVAAAEPQPQSTALPAVGPAYLDMVAAAAVGMHIAGAVADTRSDRRLVEAAAADTGSPSSRCTWAAALERHRLRWSQPPVAASGTAGQAAPAGRHTFARAAAEEHRAERRAQSDREHIDREVVAVKAPVQAGHHTFARAGDLVVVAAVLVVVGA